MIKMIFKSTLILNLFALSLNTQADTNKEFIVKQCHNLSEKVNALALDQRALICTNKLNLAAIQMNSAAEMILASLYEEAKQTLNNAVESLQFAELNGCSHYIEIAHSKFAANKLRHLL